MEIYHNTSSQSFDIINETPKTDDKKITFNAENDSEMPKLDEDLISPEYVKVPCNTPTATKEQPDSYEHKKNQITEYMQMLRTNQIYSPIRIKREIVAFSRHLEKLLLAEKKGIPFEKFKNHIITSYQSNNNVHVALKNIYH